MSNIVEALLGLIDTNKKQINWYQDTSEQIRGKAAYNTALVEVEEFLIRYKEGDVPSEYLESLIKGN